MNRRDTADSFGCFKMFNTTGGIARTSVIRAGTIAKCWSSIGSLPLLNHYATVIVHGNQVRFGKLHSSRADSLSSIVATITTCFLTVTGGFLTVTVGFLTVTVGFLVTGIVMVMVIYV